MKKAVVFIISVLTSLVFIFWLASCGSSASTKLGMTKNEVKELYDEAPTYEHNNTLYWCDDDFISLLKKYDYDLTDNPEENYNTIVTAMGNTEFKAELDNLSFRFRFARFEKENNEDKLVEFYYDFTHKFDLEDDYSSSQTKQVKEINLSKSRLDYYIIESGQWKNNKNKLVFKAELVDFDNITYNVEFEDGTLYKAYLKNSVSSSTLDEFVLNKNSKKFEMFLYVNTEMDNAKFSDFSDEIASKVSFKFGGKYIADYTIDSLDNSEELLKGRCVGYIGGPTTSEGKYTIYKWNTLVDYLPDIADKNAFTGQMKQKIWNNVIYEGYTLNPYYKVVGVQDKNKPTYEIEDGAVIIGEGAFKNLSLCYQINIPDSVVEVEENAIVNNINLVSVIIPPSVEIFDGSNLSGCPKILEIVNGSNCVSEHMVEYLFVNGAGFYTSYEDYKKNGSVVELDSEKKLIVADITGSNTYMNNYNYDGYYVVGTVKLTPIINLPETLVVNGKSVRDYRVFKYAFATNEMINTVTMSDSVKGICELAFEGCKNLETVTANGATDISSYAFSRCTKLTNISFNSACSVGDNAFEGCVRLTNISFPKVSITGNGAFNNCIGLQEVSFPMLNNIYSNGFNNCVNLTTFTAPNLTSVCYCAFEGCSKLANFTSGKISNIESSAFKGCTKLVNISITDNGYLYIADNAFEDSGIKLYKEDGISYLSSENNKYAYLYSVDSNLETVVIKNDVLCVRVESFYDADKLKSLTVQDDISYYSLNNLVNACPDLQFRESNYAQYIGSNSNPYLGLVSFDRNRSTCVINSDTKYILNNAFEDSSITSVSLPAGLNYIGTSAFSNCDYLTSVTIPQYVNYDWGVFIGCDALEEVSFYSLGSSMFSDCKKLKTANILSDSCYIPNEAFMNCTSLDTIDFSKVYSIESGAFMNCSSLTSVNLTNVVNISSRAFMNCSGLTSINLTNIIELWDSAFMNCTNLETVELGENLGYMGNSIFDGCTKLKDLVLPDRLTTVGYGIVNNCSKLAKIAIPKGVFGVISSVLGNVVNSVDVYVKNSLAELEALGFELSYLELNQKLYIYSETEPDDTTTNIKYWHYVNDEVVIWT